MSMRFIFCPYRDHLLSSLLKSNQGHFIMLKMSYVKTPIGYRFIKSTRQILVIFTLNNCVLQLHKGFNVVFCKLNYIFTCCGMEMIRISYTSACIRTLVKVWLKHRLKISYATEFFFGLSGNNSCEDLMKFLDTIPMKSLRVNRLFLELPFKWDMS